MNATTTPTTPAPAKGYSSAVGLGIKMHDGGKAYLPTALQFARPSEGKLKQGDLIEFQCMRTGSWNHPLYGQFEITTQNLRNVLANFVSGRAGQDLCLDENHCWPKKAMGWFKELWMPDDKTLMARVELTEAGAEALNADVYRYFSPEIISKGVDDETGQPITDLLTGGGLTNAPYFKNMQGIRATYSEARDGEPSAFAAGETADTVMYFTSNPPKDMKFTTLLQELGKKASVPAGETAALVAQFNQLSAEEQAQHKDAVENVIAKTAEEEAGADEAEAETEEVTTEDTGDTEDEGEDTTDTPDSGTTTIQAAALPTAEQYAAERAELMQLRAEKAQAARFSEVQADLRAFVFSKEKKTGFVNPAHSKSMYEFASKLDAQQYSAFKALLAGFRDFSSLTKEFGTGKSGGEQPVVTAEQKEAREQAFAAAEAAKRFSANPARAAHDHLADVYSEIGAGTLIVQ